MIPPISGKIAHSPAPTLEGSPVSLEAEVPDIELYRDRNKRIFGAIVKSVVRMSRFRARESETLVHSAFRSVPGILGDGGVSRRFSAPSQILNSGKFGLGTRGF